MAASDVSEHSAGEAHELRDRVVVVTDVFKAAKSPPDALSFSQVFTTIDLWTPSSS